MSAEEEFAARRTRMVERQLRGRGIGDERVLAAMAEVPRDCFVPERLREHAYDDSALPIGEEQTISQPWVVAAICQALALQGSERVLEIGTGSGYSAAVLARLASQVVSLERLPGLGEAARTSLAELDFENVEVVIADGSQGWEPSAPYDAVAVHAATPEAPHSLIGQLRSSGRLVVPIAAGPVDMLTLFKREDGTMRQETIGPCRFVPLIGVEGFSDRPSQPGTD
jgi:protein-L-isoaspartate(D-aspartate) O-methyltransferase